MSGPAPSRAVRLVREGGALVPRVVAAAAPPPPAGDQLLVRVAASSINGTDLGLARAGRVAHAVTGRRIAPGFDLAGEVVACGPAVTGFSVGDRVMTLLGHGGGAQADHVLVRQGRAARAPRSTGLSEAAAIPLAGLTALQALHGRAALPARPAARVLVVGAAGGIGSFAVQLARLAGAHVTAVADAPRAEHVRALGADVVVDRHEQDVLARGERWDVVLDVPGALRFAQVRPVLTADGVLVSTRPVSVDVLRDAASRRTPRTTAVATRRSPVDLAHLADLVDTGRLRVPLDRAYPLEEVAGAHAHARSGRLRGKVVVVLADELR